MEEQDDVTKDSKEEYIRNLVRHLDSENIRNSSSKSEFDERRVLSDEVKVHLDGKKDFYRLRNEWSKHLKVLLWILVSTQVILIFLVGMELFDFSEHKFFINIVIGGYFVELVGLFYVVVNYLFSDGDSRFKIKREKDRDY